MANPPSEGDDSVMERNPRIFGENLFESFFHVRGFVLVFRIPHPFAHPGYVGVHGDRGAAEAFGANDVRGLDANPGQGQQTLKRRGDVPLKSLAKDLGQGDEVLRFIMV